MLSNWQILPEYCQASIASAKIEQFRIFYLNHRNVLIVDEVQQQGTVDHTPLYPREVVKRNLELGASAPLMVHNHPSGAPTPSRSDIEMTRHVREAGETLGLLLHDHVVVSHGGHRTF